MNPPSAFAPMVRPRCLAACEARVYDCAMLAIYEFHVSRSARDLYGLDDTLFATDGRLVAGNFDVARRFAERVYKVSGRQIPASHIFAAALIEEIQHLLIRHYEQHNPGTLAMAIGVVEANLGSQLDETLARFVHEFPPTAVYRGSQSAQEYLAAPSGEVSNRQIVVEEMYLLSLNNRNPALEPYVEFFDEALIRGSAYPQSIRLLRAFLTRQPRLASGGGRGGESLAEILAAPAKASPYSLEGQLQYLLDKWADVLGRELVRLILRGMDYVREEAIRATGPAVFDAKPGVPEYRGQPEYEHYSTDTDWMPRLVLIAKNSYVWLEQLSRKHGRWIRTLDQIPDEELDRLAAQGFTGLWLIGLWERSAASQRIKQRMGQADAVASAYSLYSYEIAEDLGGWQALQNLSGRAAQRGIRLSADMVPNHMGIDSKWVIDHPDWFLSVDHSPFPAYRFDSGNLANDARVGIYLEDHYYDHSDAAVVFKRRDSWTGDCRYVYHGNDGTAFPWNDTAQLDYSRADVREAVIQTILHVARNFPIIRFDAAMTLTKKHIQRLWFPEPGTGGAIPSRAEHGMTRAEFDAVMPNEFWREVVDRVAAEVPETLLLAEAFWLLEGYFVRTLGMHRVYNSAFMHMLRDEDNAKYRQLIKNTLEFDPQILKRYVNFMNNPDEKTAAEQFGSGDKYFGVCTLLATLPGLPMFGHGQIEGFRERYGMEFRKPKWDEVVDEALVRGHEWKIFPLLHRRNLFADVEQFHLFDFFTPAGKVNEDVFAFSNRRADERALVLYHNKYGATRGWIRHSAATLDRGTGALRQRTLGEALGLPHDGYAIFRDQVTHAEYVRACSELWDKGLYADMAAYQHHAFVDWRFVDGHDWGTVCQALHGASCESVQTLYDELFRGTTAQEPAPMLRPAAVRTRKKPDGKKPRGKGNLGTKKGPAPVKRRASKSRQKPGPKSTRKESTKKPAAKRPAGKRR